MKTIKTLLIGLLMGFLFSGVILVIISRPAGNSIVLQPPPTLIPDMVYITGAVANPGLYQVEKGSRINDIILAAGGVLKNADQTNVNLASKAKDGEKIFIPFMSSETSIPVTTPKTDNMSTESPIPSVNTPININTANETQLDMLPGIGEQKAKQIIMYREQNGPFGDIKDLLKVTGISQNLFNQLKDMITTNS
jgi:competence protein ComEA